MKLKVGELARRTGLTVRTLHHYDSIGLLRPSTRSDSGYRLYGQADVARLHGIQVLRQVGLPLEEIGAMLAADGADLSLVVDRQLRALEREIAQASALRDRLALVQAKFADGGQPELEEWLDTLQLMTACGSYFSPAEIKLIFGNWHLVETEWKRLVDDIQVLMDAGVPPLDPRVRPLAQRWSNLMHTWMAGQFDLMKRWGQMYLAEPGVHGRKRPGLAMVGFIEPAVQLRLSALLRHMSPDDLHRLGPVADADWAALSATVQALIDDAVPPSTARAKAAARRWLALVQRASGGDPALAARLGQAYEQEPLLRETAALTPAARGYLQRAAALLRSGGA